MRASIKTWTYLRMWRKQNVSSEKSFRGFANTIDSGIENYTSYISCPKSIFFSHGYVSLMPRDCVGKNMAESLDLDRWIENELREIEILKRKDCTNQLAKHYGKRFENLIYEIFRSDYKIKLFNDLSLLFLFEMDFLSDEMLTK